MSLKKRKIKKVPSYTFIVPLLVIIMIGIFFYNPISKHNLLTKYSIYMKDGNLKTTNPTKQIFTSNYTSKLNFSDQKISEVNGVSLNLLNNTIINSNIVLFKAQRYYFPLKDICNALNYSIKKANNIYTLSNGDKDIYLSENSFTYNSAVKKLRGYLLTYNNNPFISVSDIENIFDLFAVFNSSDNTITLLDNSDLTNSKVNSNDTTTDKIALVRFEDFTCGDTNLKSDNQTRVKLMVNLLYKNGIKFHTGWIPRFKAPDSNIDNDLLTNENMVNAGFINILDYMLNKDGEIGLHGYTHQHGDERSAVGEDMDQNTNNTEEECRQVIESGIDTASALNIPISFYESAHYKDTDLQKNIINEYFKYVYEPYDNNKTNIYSPNDTNIYIPTPLGYVNDPNDISSIENGLKANNPTKLNSFFYHPSVELDFINFSIDGDKLNVDYSASYPLYRITKSINDNHYATIHVTDIE